MGAEMSGDRPEPLAHVEAVRRAEVEAARRAIEAEAAVQAAARAAAKATAEKREEAAQRAHEKRLDDLVHGAAVRCTQYLWRALQGISMLGGCTDLVQDPAMKFGALECAMLLLRTAPAHVKEVLRL